MIEGDFEKLYTQLRQREGRIYTDIEVVNLPEINLTHPHYKEWQIRKESSHKLVDHLKKRKQPLDILEIGCGNGWLCHRLAKIPESKVIGVDINFAEVQQAARVFYYNPNLHFIYGDAETGLFEDHQFDIIVFAASIQYFPSLSNPINNALRLLKSNGNIHIIDSPFYTLAELAAARQRSFLYYKQAGFPEMASQYFHHSLDELEQYNYSLHYDPNSLFNKFLRNKNPFHWICIKS
jgi:ubiquinone/menaquinone biosynthesis C-methylase UbiE